MEIVSVQVLSVLARRVRERLEPHKGKQLLNSSLPL